MGIEVPASQPTIHETLLEQFVLLDDIDAEKKKAARAELRKLLADSGNLDLFRDEIVPFRITYLIGLAQCITAEEDWEIRYKVGPEPGDVKRLSRLNEADQQELVLIADGINMLFAKFGAKMKAVRTTEEAKGAPAIVVGNVNLQPDKAFAEAFELANSGFTHDTTATEVTVGDLSQIDTQGLLPVDITEPLTDSIDHYRIQITNLALTTLNLVPFPSRKILDRLKYISLISLDAMERLK